MCASDVVRVANPEDMPALMHALQALARDLDDPFRMEAATLDAALFGPAPRAFALLAGEDGAVLAQPTLSTSLGGAVTFVSDLWVCRDARGTGLGRRLLAAAAREGAARWQSVALRLTVYQDNTRARAFYDRLGFAIREADRNALLSGTALTRLMEQP
ncbi:MAG: N-acetyltransferase [Alphaproteobacteria bacterium HGW-Alphaproteobacteria-1]|jgi:GNAT superfamily N-acetyltransferase|nr:MAG: N-acetyltransferase [Alphaproteobacteria bacterium HGW-Alphaproteobacteria-1]